MRMFSKLLVAGAALAASAPAAAQYYSPYRGYGYGNRTPYNLYYNGLRSHSRTYSRIYNPYNAGVYSPYGSGGY